MQEGVQAVEYVTRRSIWCSFCCFNCHSYWEVSIIILHALLELEYLFLSSIVFFLEVKHYFYSQAGSRFIFCLVIMLLEIILFSKYASQIPFLTLKPTLVTYVLVFLSTLSQKFWHFLIHPGRVSATISRRRKANWIIEHHFKKNKHALDGVDDVS